MMIVQYSVVGLMMLKGFYDNQMTMTIENNKIVFISLSHDHRVCMSISMILMTELFVRLPVRYSILYLYVCQNNFFTYLHSLFWWRFFPNLIHLPICQTIWLEITMLLQSLNTVDDDLFLISYSRVPCCHSRWQRFAFHLLVLAITSQLSYLLIVGKPTLCWSDLHTRFWTHPVWLILDGFMLILYKHHLSASPNWT